MEKASVKQKRQRQTGLLAAVFMAAFMLPAFAKEPSPAEIRELTVKPDSETFFTAQENGYTLKIPDVEPSKIQTDLPVLPPGVVFVSSIREEYLDYDGTRGTAIHLWFTFKDTGPVNLPPLTVMVGRRTYYLPFEAVTVYENPAMISPVVQVEYLKGGSNFRTVDGIQRLTVYAGEEIVFLVRLKFFVQVVQFNWKLPKNSLFEEVERYEITRGVPVGTDFSTDALPVAKFSWKPLTQGDCTLPDVTVVATSYNGSRRTVHLPPTLVKVLPARAGYSVISDKSKTIEAEKTFESAFKEQKSVKVEEAKSRVSAEDCIKLARLRSRERHSFPGSHAQSERKLYEQQLGLSNRASEARKPLVIAGIILTVFLAALFVVFILLGKVRMSLIFLTATIIFTVVCVWGLVQLTPDYGIFAGGTISPVPETVTTSIHKSEGGLRVKILEKAGDYYYIESEDINGWVLSSLVYEIK